MIHWGAMIWRGAALVGFVAVCGCRGRGGARADAGAPRVAEDDALAEKLNAYVDACLHRFSPAVRQGRERYESWCAAEGPTGKEPRIYGTHALPPDPRACAEAVQRANAARPSVPTLEGAASAYAASLLALEPILQEADTYYAHQDYKEDKMARGVSLHPQLMAGWEKFEHADHVLAGDVQGAASALDARVLGRLEKASGRKLPYFVKRSFLAANVAVSAGDERLEKIGVPELSAATGRLENAARDLAEYAVGHGDEVRAASEYPGYEAAMAGFVVAAIELRQRINDKKPYTDLEKVNLGTPSDWTVPGSPAKLVRSYNVLVGEYNRWAFAR